LSSLEESVGTECTRGIKGINHQLTAAVLGAFPLNQ
jgi:hypothetical protein